MTKDLQYSLEVLGVTRNNVLDLLNELSYEQMILVPDGFNNSILWNAVHNLTVQQLLCYKLSSLPLRVDDKFIASFKKGAVGNEVIPEGWVKEFKEVYLASINQLERDYKDGIFKTFMKYTTSYNITLKSIDDVINFNNTHEGLHYGYMMAQKKLV